MDGRKDWRNRYKQEQAHKIGNKKTIWMHCASLGEFEQGKPILEQLKAQYPDYAILLSFYSPSGYEYRKDYAGADMVVYLPMDTAQNADDFVQIFNPTIALFVKYEFWYHYLKKLHQNNIPTIYFSTIFQKRHIYFKWYGGFFREMLSYVSHFFVQNQESKNLLASIQITNVTIAGDTRFDSAFQNASMPYHASIIEQFIQNKKVWLIGSAWDKDDLFVASILPHLSEEYVCIIAPHNIHEKRISQVQQHLKQNAPLRFSQVTPNKYINSNKNRVLIIDSIGVLKFLYRYADAVWIGGGFNNGIHNTVEAAVYGKALMFGPKYEKFQEAKDFIAHEGAASFENKDIHVISALLNNKSALSAMGDNALAYALQQKGATNTIIDYVVVKYLSTNA